ncbi:DUF393 domain-containing protein [Pedobacter aquatilis]|uniref:DUF393 domain-containing protein n=1 Tax=Pedobacter aquatilis TaxID=351343 RepID=UPI00292FC2F8|nr:DUF393 domain-containing protein [Pedobacter aquatilis]
MKTLKNHVILFDEDCPMCHAYTKAFTRLNMLPVNGRAAYQNTPAHICPMVDKKRAANEIALVNTATGEVIYGINSLFKIIGNSIPFFKPLFGFGPFLWLMKKVYAFISYNRKIIIPAEVKKDVIQPDFKLNYRIAFLLFTWFLTAYILTAYAQLLTDFVPLGSKYREYIICGGQIIFQGVIITCYKREKLWDYLGNMMTISFAGSLLLALPLVLSKWLQAPPTFYVLYFLLIASLMLLEHLRRSRILKLGLLMSISWVFYRIVILGIIFIY